MSILWGGCELLRTLGSYFMEGEKRLLQRAMFFWHLPSVQFLQGRLFSPGPRMEETTEGEPL